jgi:hypothetical protein
MEDQEHRLRNLAALNAIVYPITGMTLNAVIDNAIPRRYRNIQRPSVKRALPRCDNMTTHRGGYCCPEHCKAHRRGDKGEG